MFENPIFTTDEFRDVIDFEKEASQLADKVNGEVRPCYYVSYHVAFPNTTDGIFIGYLVTTDDGKVICDEDELEELK